MKQLPARSNLDHLRKQAKDLLRLYRRRDPAALARFRDALPAAASKDDARIAALGLSLNDAQWCLAREHGFASWTDLKRHVEMQAMKRGDRATRLMHWLRLVYPGHIAGGANLPRPVIASRMLADDPAVAQGDPWLACATGDEAALRHATAADSGWVNRSGGPLDLPPLVAVTFSSLLRLPACRDQLYRSAQLLLDAGADPNQSAGSRWPPRR